MFTVNVNITCKKVKTSKSISCEQSQAANTKFYRYRFDAQTAGNLMPTLTNVNCMSLYDAFMDCIITNTGVNNAVAQLYRLL
jgi:hypothetical protein